VFVFPCARSSPTRPFHLEESFAEVGVTVRTITVSRAPQSATRRSRRSPSGGLDVVLTTPEFLHIHAGASRREAALDSWWSTRRNHVGMSRAGNRPAYARLARRLKQLGRSTVLAVTARADDAPPATITATLGIQAVRARPTVRENLLVEDRRGAKSKDATSSRSWGAGEKTVVYRELARAVE